MVIPKNVFEKKVESFLRDLGFNQRATNPIIMDGNAQIGEIDSIFEYNDYLFVVEVSTKDKFANEKKNYFFSKWSDAYNLKRLRKQCKVSSKNVFRIYFDMIKTTPENHAGLDHMTKRRKRNKVVYLDRYKEFSKMLNNKTLARTEFLKWLQNS